MFGGIVVHHRTWHVVKIILQADAVDENACAESPPNRTAGVEHLLRNVKDATVSTLATDIGGKVQAVRGLRTRLRSIVQYLEKVLDGTLPVNHDVMHKLQVR